MLKLIHTTICIFLFSLCHTISAQTNDISTFYTSSNSTKIELEEKKRVDEIYNLLTQEENKKAYRKATDLSKIIKTNYSKVSINLLLSKYFYKKSLIDSSIYFAKRALTLNHITNDSVKKRMNGIIYELLGANYTIKGLYKESKKWHLQGIKVSQKYDEKEFYYSHLHNLAISYMMLGDNKTALQLFKQCLEYKKDEILTSLTYSNIGDIYGNMMDYESSNFYLEKSKSLALKAGDTYTVAATLNSIGVNHQKQGSLDKAISLYNEALIISKSNGYDYITLSTKFNLGISLMELKKYDEATSLFLTIISDSKKLGILQEQMDGYEKLKEISLAQGRHKESYNYFNKEIKLKDSIEQIQNHNEIAKLEIQYKTLQKEKEIKVLQIENVNRNLELNNQKEAIKNLILQQEIAKKDSENKILSFQNISEKRLNEITLLKKDQEIQHAKLTRQKGIKNVILYSSLILLFLVVGLLIIYYQKLKAQSELNEKQKEISEQRISALIKDQELKVIKASIKGEDMERTRIVQELHDSIGGNLAAIKLQLNNSEVQASECIKIVNTQLDDTYQQVRTLSHNLIPKKFRQNNFVPLIKEYMKQVSEASNLTIHVLAYPEDEINNICENTQNDIFSILQELISNTIKHSKANQIDIQLDIINENIYFIFEDNGKEYTSEKVKTNLNLATIKNQIHDIKGTFHIDSHPKRGTIITIEIPNKKSVIL